MSIKYNVIFQEEDFKNQGVDDDVLKKLKKSEEEIEKGEGIDADEAFKELRQKYGYQTIWGRNYLNYDF